MPRFEELQELWQRQPQVRTGAADAAAVKQALRGYSRLQSRIYAAKVLLITVVLAVALPHTHGSVPVILALAGAAAIAAALLLADWRNNRALARLDFSDVSLTFVRQAIRQFSTQRDPFRNYFWPLIVSLAVLDNLVLGMAAHHDRPLARIGWHLYGTVLPLAALALGRRVRAWRFERECRPIIDRLTAMERSLEDFAE